MKIFVLFSLLSTCLFAEYRVFQYYVRSKNSFIQDNPSYLVTSTLDPQSYVAYHGGNANIAVDMVRTWICPGYTGLKQDYCASPYEKLLQARR